jgi:hypothetical protein
VADLLCRKLPESALTAKLDQAARALHTLVGLAFPAPPPEPPFTGDPAITGARED